MLYSSYNDNEDGAATSQIFSDYAAALSDLYRGILIVLNNEGVNIGGESTGDYDAIGQAEFKIFFNSLLF